MSERKSKTEPMSPLLDAKKNPIYDETQFELKLSGGPIHTDLLFAMVSFKNSEIDKSIKEPVPLMCKWYTLDENNRKEEIFGVTGAFYQPCADDIGKKILIQVTPVLGLKNYSGTPLEKEIGPLLLDEKIDFEVKKIYEEGDHKFNVKLEGFSPNFCDLNDQFPKECIIHITKEELNLIIDEKIINENRKCPQNVSMIKRSNNIFEIIFDEKNIVKLSGKNNIERDIIGMCIRMFNGEKYLVESLIMTDNEEMIESKDDVKQITNFRKRSSTIGRGTSENIDLFLKTEYYIREITKLNKEKDILSENLKNEIDKNSILEKKNFDFQEKLTNCTKNYYDLDKENEELKKKMDALLNQKHFFLQEIDIYKAESISKDEIINKLKEEMNKLMPSDPTKNDKKQKLTWVEVEDLKKTVEDLNLKLSIIKREKSELNEKYERIIELYEDLQKRNEENTNESNYLKKKYESLIQEKIIDINSSMLMTQRSRELEEEPKLNEVKLDSTLQIQKINNKLYFDNKDGTPNASHVKIDNFDNLDNYKLHEQIRNLEITVETLKITLSQEINKKNEKKKNIRNKLNPALMPNNDSQFLQKLANSLTETIADRELALENQKNINKELIRKVHELEEKLLKHNKLYSHNF